MSLTARTTRHSNGALTLLGFIVITVTLLLNASLACAQPAPLGSVTLSAGTAITDSYVVVLNDSPALTAQPVRAFAAGLTGQYGGRITHVYQYALKGFAVRMTPMQAARLAGDPRVASVEQDQVFTTLETQQNPPSWGLDRVDQRDLPLDKSYKASTKATNVTAYIIDTGIRLTHQDFGGRAVSGTDTVDNDNDATDCNGHGTHVAGTVGGSQYGLAKGVKLVAVRVLSCQGSGSTAGVVAGIDWVTKNAVKPAVANMSLGGGASATLDQAVQRSIAAGVTYAIASGNSNADGCTFSPARTPEAITVGATQDNDSRASFSNYGRCLDIFAPGVNITSAWKDGDTATNTISGTSMATPHVAGAAALYLADHPDANPEQVGKALVENAGSGKVGNPGNGSPNKLLYVGGGNGSTPPSTPPGKAFENTADVAIPDAGSPITSPISVDQAGKAPAELKVGVSIKHSYRGDLVLDLLAPSGTVYSLKKASATDSGVNVDQVFQVDASAEDASGVWTLRIQDAYRADTGTLDSWNLQF
jgi:subtilisin family serine protease